MPDATARKTPSLTNPKQGREMEREIMGNSSSKTDSPLSISNPCPNPNPIPNFLVAKKKKKNPQRRRDAAEEEPATRKEEAEWSRNGQKKGGGGVMLEGYVEAVAAEAGDRGSDGNGALVGRTKSLTDEDLEELKGCLDLGFGFSYEEIPELCNTLPALELCYSMSQRFHDEQQQLRSPDGEAPEPCATPSHSPVANWKISSPGDDPDEVKARLKYWAQAVACTVRLCS